MTQTPASTPAPDHSAPVPAEPADDWFSEQQILRPLAVALLLALALSATFGALIDPSALPPTLERFLGNGFCQLMLGLFMAVSLYALLQYGGLGADRDALRAVLGQAPGQPPASRRRGAGDWMRYLSGRRPAPASPGLDRLGLGNADPAAIGDYVRLARARQHQHNFAPIGFAIWALPLLGFIGTVVGITQAIGGLEQSVGPGDDTAASLTTVLGGLKFAFDTTFVGLVLVIPSMVYLLILRARAQGIDMLLYRALLQRPDQRPDRRPDQRPDQPVGAN